MGCQCSKLTRSATPPDLVYTPIAVTSNDHMVSFYLRTPSGFNVEYGWGAREVDDATWQVQVHTAGSIWGHQGSL
jgi:hypothetical protein